MKRLGRIATALAAAVPTLLLAAEPAAAYIGPGAGFAVVGSLLVVISAVFFALANIVFWPLRALLRVFRSRRALSKALVDRFIVVGLDGIDPDRCRRMIDEGRMPNFKKLEEMGCFHKLGTTNPSMSPVAWSSFATGVDPSKHGIFDFLTRDPKNYLPILSSSKITSPDKVLKLGKYRIPLNKPSIKLLQRAKPFWKVLSEHRVFSSVLRIPITFPPEKFYGVELSAMCTPDLRGTQGTHTYFTTKSDEQGKVRTQGMTVPVTEAPSKNGRKIYESVLPGPENSMVEGGGEVKVPFTVTCNGTEKGTLEIDGQKVQLELRNYTDWIPINFPMGLGVKASGICRFYVKEFSPHFEMYVTPINVDPDNPALPISQPKIFAIYLSKLIGRYATLGLAEDTWALNERVIDEKAFLDQSYLIHEERVRMLMDALDKTRRGTVSCVFDATDRIQHMMMRYEDPGHPANEGKDTEEHKDSIEELYLRCDQLIGDVLKKVGKKDVLAVISDHGFMPFRRGVNLNSWLLKHGYLVLKEGKTESADWFRDVDWSKTKAYTLGLTGVYINRKGREALGIVEKSEVDDLKRELIEKWNGLKDEEAGKVAIREAFDTAREYHGPYQENAPDILIGYDYGYRASWEAAVGQVDDRVFVDNVKSWSGDHCVDSRLVPGIFFCNRKINSETPHITDLSATAIHLFGVPVPKFIQGKPLITKETSSEEAAA